MLDFSRNMIKRVTNDSILETNTLGSNLDNETRLKIIEYLDRGHLVYGWMHYFEDYHTKEPIAPHAYFTDGTWVWPSYFSFYLEKLPNYKVDSAFLEHIANYNYRVPQLSKSRLYEIESELKRQKGNV